MGDFFQEVDSDGIVEDHIQSVLKLEDVQARSLLKRYREVRGDLRDRLDSIRADTFSAQQLRGVLVQVDGAIAAMNESLKEGISTGAQKAALTGVDNSLKEIKHFSSMFGGAVQPINLNNVLIAQDTTNLLLSKYDTSLDAYSQGIRSQVSNVLTNAAIEEIPFSEITARMGQFFLGEEWKLTQIARTELHNVYNLGKLNSMTEVQERYLPNLQKTLFHPMDARTGADSKFVNEEHLVVDLDKPFEYTWKGVKRSYMVPPDRPNDRSILVPYRSNWNN